MTFPNKYRYLLQNVKLFWGLFNKNISLQLKRIGCKLQNFTNLCGIFQSKFGSNYKCVIYGYVKFIEYALLPQFLKLWKIDLKCHFRDEQQISFSFNFTKEVLLLLLPTCSLQICRLCMLIFVFHFHSSLWTDHTHLEIDHSLTQPTGLACRV